MLKFPHFFNSIILISSSLKFFFIFLNKVSMGVWVEGGSKKGNICLGGWMRAARAGKGTRWRRTEEESQGRREEKRWRRRGCYVKFSKVCFILWFFSLLDLFYPSPSVSSLEDLNSVKSYLPEDINSLCEISFSCLLASPFPWCSASLLQCIYLDLCLYFWKLSSKIR